MKRSFLVVLVLFVFSAQNVAAAGCIDDGVSGKRVQVIYAHSAGTDRYAQVLDSIRQWAADADDAFNLSAQQTGGSSHIRFVQNAACEPVVINTTISATSINDQHEMNNELYAQGFNRIDRKYMLFVDARVFCGVGQYIVDDSPGPNNLANSGPHYARIDSGCWSGVIAAHELMHILGGVQNSAPHSDGQYHCTDGYDNLCDHGGLGTTHGACPNAAMDGLFDCGHDDYFNTQPAPGSYLATHWNTANSQFLVTVRSGAVATEVTLSDMHAHPLSVDRVLGLLNWIAMFIAKIGATATMAFPSTPPATAG